MPCWHFSAPPKPDRSRGLGKLRVSCVIFSVSLAACCSYSPLALMLVVVVVVQLGCVLFWVVAMLVVFIVCAPVPGTIAKLVAPSGYGMLGDLPAKTPNPRPCTLTPQPKDLTHLEPEHSRASETPVSGFESC